jgi:hypothetical protein
VIRLVGLAVRTCDRAVGMLPAPRHIERSRGGGSEAMTSAGRPSGAHLDDETGVTSMIRLQRLETTDSPAEDERSMRVVEWLLALIALVAAGVLAFIR